MVISTVLSMVRYVTESDERDFVDRLHSHFTTNMLVGLSILVSFKQFGGKPIECLTPEEFPSSWEGYAESYCWSQDTYFVKPFALVDDALKDRRITYYQWVPFLLILQASCFRLPSILWKTFSEYSGIKIKEILKLASDANNIQPDIKRTNVNSAALHIQGSLRFHSRIRQRKVCRSIFFGLLNLPFSSFYVTTLYMLTKLLYVANVIIQLQLLNRYVLLFFFAVCSFLYWVIAVAFPCTKQTFIERHMEMSEIDFDYEDQNQKKDVARFINYLGCDGTFVLRIVTLQVGVIYGTEMMVSLWRNFFGDFTVKRSRSLPDIENSINNFAEEIPILQRPIKNPSEKH